MKFEKTTLNLYQGAGRGHKKKEDIYKSRVFGSLGFITQDERKINIQNQNGRLH